MQPGSQALLLMAVAAVAFCVASCNQKTEFVSPDQRATAVASTDPATCHARGGNIRKVGINKDRVCVVKFRDAGKACSNASDCEGKCVAPYTNDLQEGTPRTGRCQSDDHMDGFGCWTEIVGGSTSGGWCN
jgi:hypothetical protein